MNKFSERLRQTRTSLGITQSDFAGMVGCKRETVSGWENKHKEPSYDILIEIAKSLQVSIDYLLGLED